MQKRVIPLKRFLKNISWNLRVASDARLQKELEQCRRSETELLKRNNFLQHILDASTTRIWHFDKEVRVVSLNKAARENLEFPLEYYIGETAMNIFTMWTMPNFTMIWI
jgi:transcriptional regulator with PAS, ATPase and Fis domain